jgi:hypothetical protein
MDSKVEDILKYLNNELKDELDVCVTKNSCIFIHKKELSISEIITSFEDLRGNDDSYSLKNILRIGKINSRLNIEIEKTRFLDFLKKEYKISSSEGIITINGLLVRKNRTIFYLIGHFTVADITSLKDFDLFKEKLKIVNKSLITVGRALMYEKFSIHIRDSSLLSLSGSSLKHLGDLYPNLPKIDIGDNIKRMNDFMEEDFEKFREYAIRDSLLTLYHCLMMEKTAMVELKKFYIPVSLASLSGGFLQSKIHLSSYSLPIDSSFQTSIQEVFTPSAIDSNKFSIYLPLILGSLHGGRNESFVYGLCHGEYYDYDLPGAYPTAMSLLSYPNFLEMKVISSMNGKELLTSEGYNLFESFTFLNIKFSFPETCSYPNLAVRLDKSSIIFPLSGSSICTGSEFLLAMKLGCKIEIVNGIYIPFVSKNSRKNEVFEMYLDSTITENKEDIGLYQQKDIYGSYKLLERDDSGYKSTDFFGLVKTLVDERSKYPPKSYNNLLFKIIANSGIGQMSRGLSRKKSYNPSLKTTSVIPSGVLTNPLYAS